MTYRELLYLYKKGELDPNVQKEIEADIEKQDAISEYLFENASDDIWDDLKDLDKEVKTDGSQNENLSHKSNDFTKEIQKSIRKAFLRMGISVGVAILAILAFCTLALPRITDSFYYDPGKIVDQDTQTNQMSLDLQVYTELNMPFARRDQVNVERNGFGNYDIYIPQTMCYGGADWHNVAGTVKKNKLTLYDANVFKKMTGNAFDWFQTEGDLSLPLSTLIEEQEKEIAESSEDGDGHILHGFAGGAEASREIIKNLQEKKLYKAYFTLNQMMSYKDLLQLINDNDGLGEVWCAVKTNDTADEIDDFHYFETDNMGFHLNMSKSHSMGWDEAKYPSLVLWNYKPDAPEEEWSDHSDPSSETMKTHMVSMLRYMEEQKNFCKLMDAEGQEKNYGAAADYIEENGLIIYGFTAIADKEELTDWLAKKEIYSIATEDYN